MSKNYPQVTSYLFDLMIILHKRVFNPLTLSKAIHLTPSQFSVLFYLRRRDNSSVTDVAKYFKISKPNMTPILDSLVKKGYLERNRDENDRRIIRLSLTPSGKVFYEDLKVANTSFVEEMFADYTAEELEQIIVHSSELLNLIKRVSELMQDDDFSYVPDESSGGEESEELDSTPDKNKKSKPNNSNKDIPEN
ncbi:MAG: MarR family transcriptional regulator [Clostridium sp.]|nr:MarR family transcriptional regulator [Clostridium sp.]